MISPSLVTELL